MWGQIIGAVAGPLLGGLFGRGDKRRARRAQQQREAILRQMQALAGEGADRGRRFMDTYERDFLPVAREAIDAARQVGRPDLAGISADNATAFQNQRGAMQREMGRRGVNPLDGAWAGEQADLANAEAASLVFNRNAARRGAASERASALHSAAGLGQMPLSAGVNLFGNAQNALAGVASGHGDDAQMYRDSAAATSGAVSQMVGNVVGIATGGPKAGGAKSSSMPWGNFVQRVGSPSPNMQMPTGNSPMRYWGNTGQGWNFGGGY
jgi:hypothetical protein